MLNTMETFPEYDTEQFWSKFCSMLDELSEQNQVHMVSPDGHPNMCSWLGSHMRSWGLDWDNLK
jgi:hypothetical protein